ncbi:MAG: polyprenyl synthetase family protein [Caulobacteraceae bacterium]
MSDTITADIVAELGFSAEVQRVREMLEQWVAGADAEMQPLLRWQFVANPKYFRPLTIFSCYRGVSSGPVPDRVIRSAVVLEMMHNVSLIIDDILDKSEERRGKATLHCRFGQLQALMASGYIVADGYRMSADDPYEIGLFSELLKRLGVAECLQWRLRRQPLGVEDWLEIAGEDTGSMFETCARLATRDDSLRKFGRLLGILYHGCDDVGDVKGLESLGGGGEEDLRDGILTLPASLAIQSPEIADLFCKPEPSADELALISAAMSAELPAAEARLDELAAEAKWEAHFHAADPSAMLALVDHTRELSRR